MNAISNDDGNCTLFGTKTMALILIAVGELALCELV